MEIAQGIYTSVFTVTNIWSVIARGVLWCIVASIVIVSTTHPDPHLTTQKIRHNLGGFLLFLVLSTGLMYLLFGFVPAS